MKRLLLVLPLVLLSVLTTTPAASAHTQLISSDPKEGAQVAAPPQQLTLTFNEPVRPEQTTVTVTGADGTAWTVGQITAKDASLLVPVTPAGPAGLYTINFKIGSADDHAVTGAVKFTMTAPLVTTTTAPPTTTTTAPSSTAPSVAPVADVQSDQSTGLTWWAWLLIAIGVAAVAGAVVWLRRRATQSA
ncbi:copper resistance protein CopC [Lentzea sp. BCCO 10_0061]|uniref:Copper resistance protein CopC n=1 Tax=Lentzea sokolovensis TaxID=3095429 RepID=A0ABU4UWU6_9PSEU|nr:copper resistance protein CopC [Lentzea sp. BCCO 10_0061]MDX8143165.1 copper resistance protein CopC [Lentzea sp. BCCO 10_0061]